MIMPYTLSETEVDRIRKLSDEKRRALGFVGDTPIANDIFKLLDDLRIFLLEYPVASMGDRPGFSAALMHISDAFCDFTFLGLNTADYLDKQIFAIAHELYHFYTKAGSHLSRLTDEDFDSRVEAEANRFAAEFLLPEQTLRGIIIEEFKGSKLNQVRPKALLRFIARLQCMWWLPYRSIVRRLRELGAISSDQYADLYSIDERSRDSEYSRLGMAINEGVFLMLNLPTHKIGTSPKNVEIIIRNFEDHLIDEEKFARELALFGKTPEEFGYRVAADEEDEDEFREFLRRRNK